MYVGSGEKLLQLGAQNWNLSADMHRERLKPGPSLTFLLMLTAVARRLVGAVKTGGSFPGYSSSDDSLAVTLLLCTRACICECCRVCERLYA